MNNISLSRSLVLFLSFVLIVGCAPNVSAKALDLPMGLLTVTGMVKVNGQPAATGDIVSSGSVVETAKRFKRRCQFG
jgi:hypothetical protein